MEKENLKLAEASPEYQEAYRDFLQELLIVGEPREKETAQEALRDLPTHIRRLQDMSRGVGLPPGYVPGTTYWLIRDGNTIVAGSNLRHGLTPELEHEGGHIGYGVRPSERRKGYGTIVCALTVQKARELALKRVLITCDADNIASAKIIEKNGGRLENQVVSKTTGKLKNRYWIQLGE
jgi:predicted acetyltransferase